MEEWKTIEGASAYEVSNHGRVRRKASKTGRCLKPTPNGYGYPLVKLKLDSNGKYVNHSIHRLVAEHFIPNPECKGDVNHIDGNKQNNHVSNLEWSTRKENIEHAWENGLTVGKKLSKEDINNIKKLYKPYSKDWNMEKLSEIYNVSISTIYRAVNS